MADLCLLVYILCALINVGVLGGRIPLGPPAPAANNWHPPGLVANQHMAVHHQPYLNNAIINPLAGNMPQAPEYGKRPNPQEHKTDPHREEHGKKGHPTTNEQKQPKHKKRNQKKHGTDDEQQNQHDQKKYGTNDEQQNQHGNTGLKTPKKNGQTENKLKTKNKNGEEKENEQEEKKKKENSQKTNPVRRTLQQIFTFGSLILTVLFQNAAPDLQPSHVMIHDDFQLQTPAGLSFHGCIPMVNGMAAEMNYKCNVKWDHRMEAEQDQQKNPVSLLDNVDNDDGQQHEMPFSIWADVDNNDGTLEKLGEIDINKDCKIGDNGEAHCSKTIDFESTPIDQLKRISLVKTRDTKGDQNTIQKSDPKGRQGNAKEKGSVRSRRLLQEAVPDQLKIRVVNQCPHPITVTSAQKAKTSLIQPTLIPVGSAHNFTVPQGLDSCRLWASTDCDMKTCGSLTSDQPVSLFEWTTTAGKKTFFDVSYVDACTLPIGVFVPDSNQADTNVTFNANLGGVVDNLWAAVPTKMQAVDEYQRKIVHSVCSAFDSDVACCKGDYNTPEKCISAQLEDAEIQKGLGAMHTAASNSYTYAYDDKAATRYGVDIKEFVVGFCTNCQDEACGISTSAISP